MRGRWIALVVAGAAILVGSWLLIATSSDRPAGPALRPQAGESERDARREASGASDARAVEPDAPLLPDGALPPLIGEPREDRIDFCDERNWRRVHTWVREVREGELIVEEASWRDAAASTRTGLASWASKCRQGGGSILIRGADSGREIGHYDAQTGYEALD